MKGSTRVAQIALFVGAAGGYLAGIADLLDKDGSITVGIIWLVAGTIALCFALAYLRLNIKDRKKK